MLLLSGFVPTSCFPRTASDNRHGFAAQLELLGTGEAESVGWCGMDRGHVREIYMQQVEAAASASAAHAAVITTGSKVFGVYFGAGGLQVVADSHRHMLTHRLHASSSQW